MKKLLVASLVLNLCLSACVFLGKLIVHAEVRGPGSGVAMANGDVNGDQFIDISDACYLLNWLFLGGSEPVPGPVSKGGSGLPDTGQTTCYDAAGSPIDCASATCPGQDGFYQTGCPPDGRFVDNGDGTVSDTCTGLMWQKDTADVNGDGQSLDNDRLTWCQALSYCANLSFAGHDDWRLPNKRELQSIVDYGRHDLAVDPVFRSLPFNYWSSTTFAVNPEFVWLVFFADGRVSNFARDVFLYARAVRTGR